jgi:hypothetical protein
MLSTGLSAPGAPLCAPSCNARRSVKPVANDVNRRSDVEVWPEFYGQGLPGSSDERLVRELLGTLDRTDFGHLGVRHEGKVRDSYVVGDVRTSVTTNRISAFDRFLGTLPFKGQVLNEIANYWFDATSDIVSNHLLEVPDPTSCAPRVRPGATRIRRPRLHHGREVQLRGGCAQHCGNPMPDGLRRNEWLEAPMSASVCSLGAPSSRPNPV